MAFVTLPGAGARADAEPLFSGTLLPPGRSRDAIAAGDLNQDGFVDLVAVHASSAKGSIYLGGEGDAFQAPNPIVLPGTPRSAALHDFDEDGRLDLLTSDRLLRGDGNGGFDLDPLLVAEGSESAHALDIDSDGDPDVLTIHGDNARIECLENRGAGRFQIGESIEVGEQPLSAAIGDVNGD